MLGRPRTEPAVRDGVHPPKPPEEAQPLTSNPAEESQLQHTSQDRDNGLPRQRPLDPMPRPRCCQPTPL